MRSFDPEWFQVSRKCWLVVLLVTACCNAGLAQDTEVDSPGTRREAAIRQLEQAITSPPQDAAPAPRRKFITTSSTQPHDRVYLETWAQRVTTVGNAHYPVAARKQGLRGEVVISATIRRDGTLESVELIRSSGSAILDAAATESVRLASPFAPIPTEDGVELLVITRTFVYGPQD